MSALANHTIEAASRQLRTAPKSLSVDSAPYEAGRVVFFSIVMDHCTYCQCKETTQNPLYHGAVWSDPFGTTPDEADYAYCENCNNRGGWNTTDAHRYFAYCSHCDREFWHYGETEVLEEDNPHNTMGETGCLRCIRNHQVANEVRCRLCGHTADGYYCLGLCRECECGCLANCPALARREEES